MTSHGIILLNKRSGVTSFDELRFLKKHTGLKKLGHAGTLDKFATGVLIVLVGYMTKFTQYFVSLQKEYQAVFTFGAETETLDPEGKVIYRGDLPSREQVISCLEEFTGEITQTPPEYSAVHINGKRAYQLARSGNPAEMPERTVQITSLELLDWHPPEAEFRITCSKGTYIRSLARDIAKAAESRGYVKELARTSVGPYHIAETTSAPEVDPAVHMLTPAEAVDKAFPLDIAQVIPEHVNKVRNGIKPRDLWLVYRQRSEGACGFLLVTDETGTPVGWYYRDGSQLETVCIPQEVAL